MVVNVRFKTILSFVVLSVLIPISTEREQACLD